MLTAEMEMEWKKKKKKSKYSEIKGVKWEIKKETAISLYPVGSWTGLVSSSESDGGMIGCLMVYVNDDDDLLKAYTFGIIRNSY